MTQHLVCFIADTDIIIEKCFFHYVRHTYLIVAQLSDDKLSFLVTGICRSCNSRSGFRVSQERVLIGKQACEASSACGACFI